ARREGPDDFGAVLGQRGVDQCASGQRELVEQVQTAPHADAVAILAPCEVQHVGLVRCRRDACAQAFAEREVLEVEADVDRQPRTVRPLQRRPVADRRIREAAVRGDRLEHGHATALYALNTSRSLASLRAAGCDSERSISFRWRRISVAALAPVAAVKVVSKRRWLCATHIGSPGALYSAISSEVVGSSSSSRRTKIGLPLICASRRWN